ncbi:hypothetical protein EVAR_22131_1 [Eumeta japonica]|uniref:Uncharacterized protein n=1 Tax=Eumeta variegata TaxID=151549 RepID=A0A4C1W299_EUMVA|nr:hypothetical protein EVAR_22131_1 [Eumeta japonica]
MKRINIFATRQIGIPYKRRIKSCIGEHDTVEMDRYRFDGAVIKLCRLIGRGADALICRVRIRILHSIAAATPMYRWSGSTYICLFNARAQSF